MEGNGNVLYLDCVLVTGLYAFGQNSEQYTKKGKSYYVYFIPLKKLPLKKISLQLKGYYSWPVHTVFYTILFLKCTYVFLSKFFLGLHNHLPRRHKILKECETEWEFLIWVSGLHKVQTYTNLIPLQSLPGALERRRSKGSRREDNVSQPNTFRKAAQMQILESIPKSQASGCSLALLISLMCTLETISRPINA